MRLSESRSPVAGTLYTLTCTVTFPSGVQLDDSVPPNIQWPLPDTITIILTPTGPSKINSGVYVSNITLNPLQETYSGQYSCSASYSLRGISSEVVTDKMNVTVISEFFNKILLSVLTTVSYLPHTALTAPGVSVRDEGSAVTGFNYTLICEVTIPPFNDTITVSEACVIWTHPSGETESAVGNSVQLLFSPLTSDDDGVYTCTAHYLADGIASPQGNDSHEVSVSKSLCFCILRSVSHPTYPSWISYPNNCPLHRS